MRHRTRFLVMDEHTGTHADAPIHFVDEPHRDVEGLELGHMMGPACVIDVTRWVGEGGDGRSAHVPPSAVEDWEDRHGPLQLGDVVLLHSGWDERFRSVAEGGDAYATDPFVHQRGPGRLARDVVFVELLCRLGELPPRGATFLFLPIKLRGGTGGPGRAIAFLPA